MPFIVLCVIAIFLLLLAPYVDRFLTRKVAWTALTNFFDRCAIPKEIRPQLMFVSPSIYGAWEQDGLIPYHYLSVCAKWLLLRDALIKKCGTDAVVGHWLLGKNLGDPFFGRTPVSIIIDGGEAMLNTVLATCEHQH
jgi:hypothetical protein